MHKTKLVYRYGQPWIIPATCTYLETLVKRLPRISIEKARNSDQYELLALGLPKKTAAAFLKRNGYTGNLKNAKRAARRLMRRALEEMKS